MYFAKSLKLSPVENKKKERKRKKERAARLTQPNQKVGFTYFSFREVPLDP